MTDFDHRDRVGIRPDLDGTKARADWTMNWREGSERKFRAEKEADKKKKKKKGERLEGRGTDAKN